MFGIRPTEDSRIVVVVRIRHPFASLPNGPTPIEDASATELDASLVSLFVKDLTSLPDARLPGADDRQGSLRPAQDPVA